MAESSTRTVLTRELLDEAAARARALPVFERSHRQKQANLVGCIGEVVFERFLTRNNIRYEDHREGTRHDYLVGGKLTVDVKTKDRTVRPKKHFDNSVPEYNHEHQRPDYYYFVSLLRSQEAGANDINRFTHAFLLGGIDIGTLDMKGKHWPAGSVDPSNGTEFWTACINVGMDLLVPNAEMLEIFRRAM